MSLPCHAGTASFFPAPLQDFETTRARVLKHLARSERATNDEWPGDFLYVFRLHLRA